MLDDLSPHSDDHSSDAAAAYVFGPVALALELAGFDVAQARRIRQRLDCVHLAEGGAAHGSLIDFRLRATGAHPLRYDEKVYAAAAGEWVLRHDFTLVRDESMWLGECISLALSAEYALRWAVAIELLALGGLLLHGSSVRQGGGAHVFLGASGVGKSTIAFEGGFDAVFSDELTIVAPDPLSGRWTVWASPFWGQLREPAYQAPTPLRGVWILDGRGHTEATDIEDAEAAMALYARVIDIAAAEAAHGIVLGTLSDLIANVPVRKLSWCRGEPLGALVAPDDRPVLEVTEEDLLPSDDGLPPEAPPGHEAMAEEPVFDFPARFRS